MNTIVLRVLVLFAGFALVLGMAYCFCGCRKEPVDKEYSNEAASLCVIEVRQGGGLEPEPHTVWISIYRDGLIRTRRSGEHYADRKDVELLIGQIEATGLFDIDQTRFEEQLQKAGELNRKISGGSGVYTISVLLDQAMHTLQLNQPQLYAESAVVPARQFFEVLTMIENFASKQ